MSASVSVVILSHRPRLLPEAVRSVMRQTVPCELIVKHRREGYPEKIHEAVRAATGDFLILLCDDDLLAPEYVERCLRFANDGDMVFTDRRVFWNRWEWRQPSSWWRRAPRLGFRHRMFGRVVAERIGQNGGLMEIPPQSFAFGSPLPMTCTIRRELWDRLGGYDNVHHADTEFWYRAIREGARIVYIPQPLFWYRFHGTNISREHPSNGRAALDFHRKWFQDFGFAFEPHPASDNLVNCTIIPEPERAEYARRHGLKVVA